MIEQRSVQLSRRGLPGGSGRPAAGTGHDPREAPHRAPGSDSLPQPRRVGALRQDAQSALGPGLRSANPDRGSDRAPEPAASTRVIPALRHGSATPGLAWLLTIGGGLGLLAALLRTLEQLGLLGDRSGASSCSEGLVLGCEPVPTLLGTLNPLLGVAGFAMLCAVGAVLTTGVALSRVLWLGLQAGVTFGVVFVHGLVLANLSQLGRLCPYCLLAGAVMVPLFWYTTVHTISRGWLPVHALLRRPVWAMVRNPQVVLITWYLLAAALIYVTGGWLTRNPPADGAWLAVALITVATLAGAWTATRFSDRMGLLLSLAAAMMMGIAVTDVFPHVVEDAAAEQLPLWIPAIAALVGFLVLSYFTHKGCAHGHDDSSHDGPGTSGGRHRLTSRAATTASFGGVGAALALSTHRLVEGATLALTPSVAVIVALFVHAASEGLAFAALIRSARGNLTPWLLLSAAGPALGVVIATINPLPPAAIPVLLAMVGGVLLRTALVGVKLAVAKRRSGELRNVHIAAAAAAAVALGVLTNLTHGHGHGPADHAGGEDDAGHHAGDHAAGGSQTEEQDPDRKTEERVADLDVAKQPTGGHNAQAHSHSHAGH